MSTLTHGPAYGLAHDGIALLGRQVRRARNNPGLLVLTQTMPVSMLLFFGYVFGSALAVPGAAYRSFLVPGLLAATAAGGIMTGMFQAAQDVHRGVTDRLRTLPVSRAAVPLAQAVADTVLTAAGTVPFLLVGVAVGWRVEGGALAAAGALALLLLFRFACVWAGIFLGLLTRDEEAAGQLGGATFLLPLLSSAYIPADGLPGPLRTAAEWNPISAVTTALRDLFGNAPVPEGAAWPVAHPVAGTLAWCAVLLAVFVPLAVRRYAHGER
ncbi:MULTISPECIES: ABC transporter permease [Streptomyces]|uniref:Transport permease protein n=2 Tax=Streptomyces TaxID=1883 RepID=A0ABT9LB14_STRGD|nr:MULTISPECIES: ABC transporter permease [Streptomyces]MDP9680919.1 ABC-2 type transport system permease protein [Streptomyces griseoviridis]GGT17092.1 transport permease protein [Streptomyces griseoviridis]GGU59639.1 transport permease protein [Streptomyces daghestanicus]GHI28541.1 transport permease protein [Streptomyces daghestanicus]